MAKRIVAASLAHPDLGPQRIARILAGKGMPVSSGSVYKTLRTKGLQNRARRLRFLEENRRLERPAGRRARKQAAEPSCETLREQIQDSPGLPDSEPAPESPATPAPTAAEDKPEPPADIVPAYVRAPAGAPRVDKKEQAGHGKERWLFRGVNLLLAAFMVWLGARIGLTLYDARQGPVAAATGPPAPDSAATPGEALSSGRPLSDYHTIADRNLFGTSGTAKDAARRDNTFAEKIPAAEKNLGLKLIGTVVADDPVLNYAVIDAAGTREQGIFRERERVGRAVIYRILRNVVIIQTDAGQRRRLSVEDDAVKTAHTPEAPLPAGYGTLAQAPESSEIQEREIRYLVPREAAASLMDTRRIIEETLISQHMDAGRPSGLRLGTVSPRNPIARVGLRSGDVVKALNNKEISGPDEAETLLQALGRGGDHTILIERGGRLQRLNLNIE